MLLEVSLLPRNGLNPFYACHPLAFVVVGQMTTDLLWHSGIIYQQLFVHPKLPCRFRSGRHSCNSNVAAPSQIGSDNVAFPQTSNGLTVSFAMPGPDILVLHVIFPPA